MSTTSELPSRKPEDYRPEPGGHLRRRLNERDIPGTVIRMAIESGDNCPGRADKASYTALVTEYLGYEWEVILDPENRYVITAYSPDGWHN